MNLVERKLESIINIEALNYAKYTVENRAIPNMIDGFKPVQRFVVYRAIEMAKGDQKKFHKLASVAGSVADAGYHHGEVSAQDAGALMANTWNNNVPFLDGDGNFGSRLVQKGAQARYVFCRVSQNFRDLYKDLEICPEHEDLEHLPPKFYLPIVPTVLLNGVRGIATGYSTTILPHSLASVVECTKLALNGKLDKQPQVSFPEFKGDVVSLGEGKYELHGKYNFVSKTQIYISEIPYKFDRADYVEKVLYPLEDAGYITYDDDCSKDGFGFKIKFRKEYKLPTDPALLDEKIKSDFKLIEKISQNIVVIDEKGNLKEYTNAKDLIIDFVAVRKQYVSKRIEHMIEKSDKEFRLSLAKAYFIKSVNANEIAIKGKTKSQLKEELSSNKIFAGFEDQLVSMNIYHMTDDEVDNLKEKAKQAKENFEYWKNTTPEIEYEKDLNI